MRGGGLAWQHYPPRPGGDNKPDHHHHHQQEQRPPGVHDAVPTLTRSKDSRIDPLAIPRPLSQDPRLSEPGGKRVDPTEGSVPPPSTCHCTYIEQESSTPRFLRPSLNLIPTLRSTYATSKVPLAVVLTPFASTNTFECPVPQVDLSPYSPIFTQLRASRWDDEKLVNYRPGPPRCQCGSYVNPFFRFSSTMGTCNLCDVSLELPEYYQSALQEHINYVGNPEDFKRALRERYDLKQTLPMLTGWCRPELMKGTVDFITHAHPNLQAKRSPKHRSKMYRGAGFSGPTMDGDENSDNAFVRPEKIVYPRARPCVIAVVDCSLRAVQCEFTRAALNSIKGCLKAWPETELDFCIVTYSDIPNFYLVRNDNGTFVGQGVQVVPDVGHPFLPASGKNLLVRLKTGPNADIDQIDSYVDWVMKMAISAEPEDMNASMAAVSAAVELLEQRNSTANDLEPVRGGTICLFSAGPCTSGVGACQGPQQETKSPGQRGGQKLKTVERPNVYVPQPELTAYYNGLSQRCALAGISLDVFAATVRIGNEESKMHIGNLGHIVRGTGGKCYLYSRFSASTSYERMYYDLLRTFSGNVAFNCALRIRVSKGLEVKTLMCPWSVIGSESGGYGRDPAAFQIPRLDQDTSILFELAYAAAQLPGKVAYVQVGCSYTTWQGYRYLRVLNRKLFTAEQMGTVFRHADAEPVVMFLTRKALLAAMTGATNVRQDATDLMTDLLFSYRIHSAVNSPAGQLILPESLKMVPVYVTGLLKNKALRWTARDDQRAQALLTLLGASLPQLTVMLYPRLFPLWRNTPVEREELSRVGLPTGIEDFVYVPRSIPASGQRVTVDGIYLLDNGIDFVVYIAEQAEPKIVEQILPNFQARWQEAQFAPLPLPPSTSADSFSARVWSVIHQIRREKFDTPFQSCRIVVARSIDESDFIWNLVEDCLGSEQSYINYLCGLHRSVQDLLNAEN